jgi:hypothetical protein
MKARISKPTKSSMQSGGKKTEWLLEFPKKSDSLFKEHIMARTSSKDMSNQVKLFFPSKKDAIEYAISKNLEYEIIAPEIIHRKKKSYSSNFK